MARRARLCGANIKTGARVESIDTPKGDAQPYVVTLTSGELWTAPSLLVGTGRLMNALKQKKQEQPKLCYIGAKAHFADIDIPTELVMHLMPGAYFGIAPIGMNRVNVAGIIACTPEEVLDPKAALYSFLHALLPERW